MREHKKPLLWTYARPTLFGLFQSSRLLDATNNRKWGLHTSAMRSVATMPVAAWYFESFYLPGNIRQQQNEKNETSLSHAEIDGNSRFCCSYARLFLSTGNKPIALGPLPSQSQASTAIPKLLRCDHDLKVTRYLTRNVSIKILSSLLDLSIS